MQLILEKLSKKQKKNVAVTNKSFYQEGYKMKKIYKKLIEAVVDGELDDIIELTNEALEDEETPQDILNLGLLEGMNIVGAEFKEGTMYVPEVLMSAKAVDTGLEIIKPFLAEGDIKIVGKVVFCTVEGDLHDIGKKLCCMLLSGSGYEVIDIGADVKVDEIVKAVKEHQPKLLAMSAMLTTTMGAMAKTIEALKVEGITDMPIMVGGAPLSVDYAKSIGANYSQDAIECVELANKLLGVA